MIAIDVVGQSVEANRNRNDHSDAIAHDLNLARIEGRLFMLLPMFVTFAFCYALGSLLLWVTLKQITQKFQFRQPSSSDEQQKVRSSYPWLPSVVIAAAFALPFIPAHPAPNIDNWGAMLSRTSMLMGTYGIMSLACWIRMAIRPTLLTLYLAINGMIMCGLSVCLLILIGGASPS